MSTADDRCQHLPWASPSDTDSRRAQFFDRKYKLGDFVKIQS